MAQEQSPSLVADDASQAGVPGLFVSWLGAVGERFRTSVDIAFAETRLAISTFMLMIFLSILAAGALLFAWALLLFAVAQWPISMGYSPVGAALILAIGHVLLGWLLWRFANALGHNMEFPETRRLLRPATDSAEEAANRDS